MNVYLFFVTQVLNCLLMDLQFITLRPKQNDQYEAGDFKCICSNEKYDIRFDFTDGCALVSY